MINAEKLKCYYFWCMKIEFLSTVFTKICCYNLSNVINYFPIYHGCIRKLSLFYEIHGKLFYEIHGKLFYEIHELHVFE